MKRLGEGLWVAVLVAAVAATPFALAEAFGTRMDLGGMLRDVFGEKSAEGDCDLSGLPSVMEITIAANMSDCDLPGLAEVLQ